MPKKPKLSQWHDGSVKPVHVGVYLTGEGNWYKKWNGEKWMWGSETITGAARENESSSLSQESRWRGIVK